MSDNTELRRLARRVIDIEALDGGEPIGDAWGEFEAAATPAAVLAMIAENESLHAQHARDSGELRKLCAARDSARRERDQLKTELEKTQLIGRLAYNFDGYKAALDERDQLRAENAGLKTGYEACERVNAELKGEVEGLRNALRPLLAHWDDLRPGESINVDAARAALGQGEQS